ncbi:hypothetical protein JCM11641_000217 [Rhodosporidiobolus odoratus]
MAPRKVVVVTGSSTGGIGHAICEEFAHQDCIVYATARRLSSLSSLPENVHKVKLDVVDPESCKHAIDLVISEQGRIDVLVNNAGMGGTGPLLDANVESEDGAKATFETNFWAPLRLAKLVVPHMAERREGLIVNVGSVVGNIPTPWSGIYGASKAALHSATEVLRMEVQGFGVNVMLVAPGAITSQFGSKQVESIKMPEDSLYKEVADKIVDRANLSQRGDHSAPAAVLAKGIVSRSLRPRPAAYYTAGGKSLVMWIFERLPRRLVSWIMARALGTTLVGKARKTKAA